MNFSHWVFLSRRAWDKFLTVLPATRQRYSQEICAQLAMFSPHSTSWNAGIRGRAALALRGSVETIVALQSLGLRVSGNEPLQPVPIDAITLNHEEEVLVEKLAERFAYYGSDKAYHGYHRLYAKILEEKRGERGGLLEIGLGTNNVSVPSNMGVGGRPGASLRAFRDLLAQFLLFGADVDTTILFEEERIRTFPVDQTDPDSLDALGQSIGRTFDVIIDDGLHAPHANLNTLAFAINWLKPGGWCCIEDITESMLPVWQVVALLLEGTPYEMALYQAKQDYLVVVRRKCVAQT